MAYRSSSSIATTTGTSTDLTVTAPAGTAQNDIVLLGWANGGESTSTITWPSGFTELADASVSGPDTKTIKLAWKREGASPPANYLVSTSMVGGDKCVLIAAAFSGRATGSDPAAQSSTQTSASASPITVGATGVTASTGDDIAWFVSGASTDGFSGWDFTAPTNYTERQDAAADFYSFATLASRDNVSSGATGTISGTMTLAAATGGWGAIVVRIPAAAGGGSSILKQTRRYL